MCVYTRTHTVNAAVVFILIRMTTKKESKKEKKKKLVDRKIFARCKYSNSRSIDKTTEARLTSFS